MTPNQITMLTLVTAAAAAVAIATGHFAWGSALVIGGGTLDIVDGHLARTEEHGDARGGVPRFDHRPHL